MREFGLWRESPIANAGASGRLFEVASDIGEDDEAVRRRLIESGGDELCTL